MKRTDDIKSMHWDITKQCNLRCRHCYNADKYFNNDSLQFVETEMTLDECLSVVDKLQEDGFRHLHFLGGEPLASPYLFEVIERAKEYNMIVSINSNAILLDNKMQQRLIDLKVDQFAASLDGCTAEINDYIRGGGTFDLLYNNVKQLNGKIAEQASELQTLIVFTLTKANSEHIKMLPQIASELGVGLITLTTFIESGNGNSNKGEFNCDIGYLCEKIEEMVASNLRNYNIVLQLDMRPLFCEYLVTKYGANVIYNIKNSLCSAGESVWYLEADGITHPCLVYQLEIGKKALSDGDFIKERLDIKKLSMDNIRKSIYWESFIKKKRDYVVGSVSTCKGCMLSDVCSPCFMSYAHYDTPVLECEYIKTKMIKEFNETMKYKFEIQPGIEFINKKILKNSEVIISSEDEISDKMVDFIRKGISLKDLLEYLFNTYDVDIDWLKHDMDVFVNTLLYNGIIYLYKEEDVL